MKNIIKKITAAGIALTTVGAMTSTRVLADEPTTAGVTVETGEPQFNSSTWAYTIPVTVTIDEGAAADRLHVNVFDNVDTVYAEPGDSIYYDITVVNNSGKDYAYAVNSGRIYTHPFDASLTDEMPNRSVNPAFAALFGYSDDWSRSDQTACIQKMTDAETLGAALKAKGYGTEEMSNADVVNEYLDDYFCDFVGVNSIDEMTNDQLLSLYIDRFNFPAQGGNQANCSRLKETNANAAYAGWKLFYGYLYTADGYGILDYSKEGSDAVQHLNTVLGAMEAEALKTGVNFVIDTKLNGPYTTNAWQNVSMPTSFCFDLTLGGEASEKTSDSGMDKKIVVDGVEVEAATIAAGETVAYALHSNVPQTLGNYVPYELPVDPIIGELPEEEKEAILTESSYPMTFHDVLDAGFSFNNDAVVTVNGKELASDLYTVTTENEDGCTFEVAMDLIKIYAAEEYFTFDEIENAPEIVVSYTATAATELSAGTYNNTAWVNESQPDIVKVDTYGIKIFKYDQKNKKKGLAGAEFELKNEAGEVIATLVSDEEGNAIIDGLDAGTYTLTETKAPENFIKSDTPVTIELPKDADDTNYALVNFANTEIPHTGGTGTAMFTTAGIALLVLAAAAYIISRRKEA